jgi:hypothetical protein
MVQTNSIPHKMYFNKRSHPLKFLVLGILALFALAALIYFVSPSQLIPVSSFQISILPLFFLLTFVFFFSGATFALGSKIHGILLGFLVITYLIFRLNDLTHPFFALLLLALFLVLELLFTYRK